MRIYIVSQNPMLSQRIQSCLKKNADVRLCQESRDVLQEKRDPSGCLIFWDCSHPERVAELVRELEEQRKLSSLVLVAQEETADVYKTGMEIRACGVLHADFHEEEMECVLGDAEAKLLQKRIVDMKLRTFRQLRFAVVGSVLRGMLMHSPNEVDLEMLQELKMIPNSKSPLWLVDIHVTNRSAHPKMERTMFSTAIGNISKEVFLPLNEMVSMAWMDDDLFVMFLQNEAGEELDRSTVMTYLGTVRQYLSKYLDWQTSMYISCTQALTDTPGLWGRLEEYRKENVSLFPGVFDIRDRATETSEHIVSGIQNLRPLLLDGCADLLEQEGKRYLSALMKNKRASRKTLQTFYQEYLKLVYSVMWEKNWNAAELFQTDEEIEILNNAPTNITTMERFMHHVSDYFNRRQSEHNAKNTVEIVCRYIMDHYGEPLTREELASYIHMNPDYLTRIFRKETGMTIKNYILKKRMEAAQMLLRSTKYRINEIAEMVGYTNYSYFTQNYHKEFGITPKQERDAHGTDNAPKLD